MRRAITTELTAHQREVLTALALNEVPIDVLARSSDELFQRLLGPAGPELSCEQRFEQLDRYVELELAGVEADERIPGMRAHLDGCPACNEDRASLRALLEQQ